MAGQGTGGTFFMYIVVPAEEGSREGAFARAGEEAGATLLLLLLRAEVGARQGFGTGA